MNINQMHRLLKAWTATQEGRGRTDRQAYVVGSPSEEKSFWVDQRSKLSPWQIRHGKADKSKIVRLSHAKGELALIRAFSSDAALGGHRGLLSPSPYALARDNVGAWTGEILKDEPSAVTVHLLGLNDEQALGAVVGVNLAGYRLKQALDGEFVPKTKIEFRTEGRRLDPEIKRAGETIATAVNLARHFTNLPANVMHPQSFAQLVQKIFARRRHFKSVVWRGQALQKQGMRLLEAVGRGSENPPCFLHLSYRPPLKNGKSRRREAPVAFVGKGITFDSGGLNIKPASGMRLMKKDMAGAAALVGLAWWVSESACNCPCDFYFALAENSISGTAFRPGDIFEARSGVKVEIHNTDAEGRLVLADALDVAVKQSVKPQLVVDVATLTGAIKYGLGADVAGLFGNDDDLMSAMEQAAAVRGDPLWSMPLVEKYRSKMKAHGADLVNAVDGFGGAITAALFLNCFTDDRPWLHLDIYGWKDSADGAIVESGASGQPVQALIEFLRQQG